MGPHIVLFTRDLRVHDHPALRAAAATGSPVVPVFVLDDAIVDGGFLVANRGAYLHDALVDLDTRLTDLGAPLVIRRGDVVQEMAALADETGAEHVHLSADVSRHAARRLEMLRDAGEAGDFAVTAHPGVTIAPPLEITPTSGGPFQVFTPYWRRWSDARDGWRDVLAAPTSLGPHLDVELGDRLTRHDLVHGDVAPDLIAGGETAARERLDHWLDKRRTHNIADYEDGRDDLSIDGTSNLSADLHFGTLSPMEVAQRLDLRERGNEAFMRQLCWRDFHHQLTAAHGDITGTDFRTKDDQWRDDPEALQAWKDGRTGYPIVDAGMRQLRETGWMHNRVRMIVASFLCKDLYIDWRHGAQHFFDHLVDGDVANNGANWQWVAGTGTDSRPNRVYNPTTQSKRYDKDGDYIRRFVPELADLDAKQIHEPWTVGDLLTEIPDYPKPIVDHAEARDRFLEARGKR